MIIQFVNLRRQNIKLKKQLMPIIQQVIEDADFNMGSRLEQFETDFAKSVGKKYAIGVNSGTDALLLSLMAYGVGRGDEVILPQNGYFSTAMVISNLGAKPKFVDIDSDYYTIDPKKIEKAISNKTKVIIPVHLFGQPVDMDPILKIARKHRLVVIEDACQAHGASYKNKRIPVGETGAFSFYPSKNLGAFGDGGIVVTDNKKVAENILYLRNDGSFKKYIHPMFGIKSRLDTLQAAILSVKLSYLEAWNELRINHARKYSELLERIPEIKTPKIMKNANHVFHLYVIESNHRDKLQKYLKHKGIETLIHYPIPIHLQPPYKKEGYRVGDYPITEKKSKKILSLPIFPEMTEEEIRYVADSVKKFYSNS